MKRKLKTRVLIPVVVVLMYVIMFHKGLFFGDTITRIFALGGLTMTVVMTYVIMSIVSVGKEIKTALDKSEAKYYAKKNMSNTDMPTYYRVNEPRENRIPGQAYKPTNKTFVYDVEYEDVN